MGHCISLYNPDMLVAQQILNLYGRVEHTQTHAMSVSCMQVHTLYDADGLADADWLAGWLAEGLAD